MDRVIELELVSDKMVHGNRYKEETKAEAFQLWALTCSRNFRRVTERLNELGVEVDERTVRRWADAEEWPGKVGAYLRQLAPGLNEKQLSDLFLGRGEALEILREIATDPTQATKDRLTAAIALVDRGGMSHVGSKADPTSSMANASVVQDDEVLEGLSVSELMAIEARARGKKKG